MSHYRLLAQSGWERYEAFLREAERDRRKRFRAMLTTNDEPNKPMRGINARLGYQPLPAEVMLEKRLR